MSKPRYRWWGFARNMIRDYQGLKQSLADLHRQNMTADNTGMPKGGGGGRTVEGVALRQLPPDDQKVYDAVTRAIELTRMRADGEDHIKLIQLMYWAKKQMTAKAASVRLHISDVTAKRWHGDFVRLVGKCYGYNVDTPKPK